MTHFFQALVFSFLFLFFTNSFAQLNPEVIPTVWPDSIGPVSSESLSLERPPEPVDNGLPNIVLIGYWPPTNEMVREFSASSIHNPSGWRGENWRGLGYNIYSFFPEFPQGLGKGVGHFEVDYQDTSEDFWRLVPAFEPVAVLSYGRSSSDKSWEIEMITRNLDWWIGDFMAPFSPTPNPPDEDFLANASRNSNIPGGAIVDQLNSQTDLNAFVDSSGAGKYLCEYLGYHLSWYQNLNPQTVQFAAHTHIGSESSVDELKEALYLSLETMIGQLE